MSNNDNLELMAAERLRYTKITNDIDIDVMSNLKEMLSRNLFTDDEFSIKKIEIYDSDIENIPSLPCICLEHRSTDIEQRTIGKIRATFEKLVNIDLILYHSDLNDKSRQNEVTKMATRIISIINRNRDLNGYCRKGIVIGKSSYKEYVKNNDKLLRSFLIPLTISVIFRDRAAGPG